MPQLSSHQSAQTTKMLLIGDSGAGKTGALASLALAGYNLRILDLDSGLDVLANILRAAGPASGEALKRVKFMTITDPMKNVGGKLVPRNATVWQRSIGMLDNWTDGEEKLGPISSWTDKDVLVIDSLTFLSAAALNFILSMNARIGQKPHQSDWYDAQLLVEGLLQMLYDEGIKCNVIVISHITYIGEENGPVHGYPASLGKALSPKIGRYFNSALLMKSSGSGALTKKKLFTSPNGIIELKNTNPLKVKPDYPIETGLADYFKDVRTAVV